MLLGKLPITLEDNALNMLGVCYHFITVSLAVAAVVVSSCHVLCGRIWCFTFSGVKFFEKFMGRGHRSDPTFVDPSIHFTFSWPSTLTDTPYFSCRFAPM